MRAPSLMELELRVIQGAAQASEAVHRLAPRPSATILIPPMPVPFFGWREPICEGAGLERGPHSGLYSRGRVRGAAMLGEGDMRFGRIVFPLMLGGLALGPAAFGAPPKPDPKNQQ